MKTFLIFNSHFQSHSKTNLLTPSVNGNFFLRIGEFAKIRVSFLMTQFPSKFNISSQSGSEQFFYFLYLSMFQKIASLLSKVQPNDFLVIFGKIGFRQNICFYISVVIRPYIYRVNISPKLKS